MAHYVPSVTISLLSDAAPQKGQVQIVARFLMTDKNMIDKAAYAIGMTQADFFRQVLVNSAKEIHKQIEADTALEKEKLDAATQTQNS